jgi:energy-converting hydrogenase Eha subunit G
LNQIYLINCESNFYRAILVDLCHDVMRIRVYSVCIDAETFLFLPNLVLHLAFLFTLGCIISRFTTRMLAANLIKVWIALQDSDFYKD